MAGYRKGACKDRHIRFLRRNGEKRNRALLSQKRLYSVRIGSEAHPAVLFRKAENRQAEFCYSLSRGHSSGAEIRNENRFGTAECSDEGRPPKKE